MKRTGNKGGFMLSKTWKIICAASLAFLGGCTTEAAKKAMDRPMPTDNYTGFDSGASDKSKRKAEKPKDVKADMAPEEAVSILVKQMQESSNSSAASYVVNAEEQLTYWGSKPGGAQIVVRGVRPLLKSKSVEQRAPALRLTVMFGGRDSLGDFIECLGDREYGIREMAYRAVLSYAPRDFSYDPQGGEVARAQAVDQYRRWWQYETQKGAVQPPTIYEKNGPPREATVQTSRQKQALTTDADNRR
jgi:hypothetical protein